MTDFSIAQKIAIWALPVLFAITIHEVAHGWVASRFGDQTARLSGRLTLNPIKHIDLVGTIIVPLVMLVFSGFIFGWARPVPVDPRNMRNPRRDMIIVAAAGPVSNLIMAIIWAGIAKLSYSYLNGWFGVPLVLMGEAGVMINVVLAVLNCFPLPPLDGGRIAMNLLPKNIAFRINRIEPYSFLILVLLLVSGVLFNIIGPPIFFLNKWIAVLFGLP